MLGHRTPSGTFGAVAIAAALVLDASAAAEAPLPPRRPPELSAQAAPLVTGAPDKDDSGEPSEGVSSCIKKLKQAGVQVEWIGPIRDGPCGAAEAIKVSNLANGVKLAPAAVMTCPLAEALHHWVSDTVAPEAERHLASAPSRILVGTGYECRGQNRQRGAKLSEHAFANAVDVMGFEFHKGSAVAVAPRGDESPASLFQAAVRQGACKLFTTVLGPGSDAAHADHLHLDLRQRKPGGRLCQ